MRHVSANNSDRHQVIVQQYKWQTEEKGVNLNRCSIY